MGSSLQLPGPVNSSGTIPKRKRARMLSAENGGFGNIHCRGMSCQDFPNFGVCCTIMVCARSLDVLAFVPPSKTQTLSQDQLADVSVITKKKTNYETLQSKGTPSEGRKPLPPFFVRLAPQNGLL